MAVAQIPCPNCGAPIALIGKCECSCGFKFKKSDPEKPKIEKPYNPKEVFEVSIDAYAYWNQNDDLVVELKTNLPDESELLLTVSCGNNYDYSDESAYEAETEVVVSGGKAVSEGFSHRDRMNNEGYDLYVSMYLPRYQPESVQAKIGLKGEYVTGRLVEKDDYDKINHVHAYFTMTFKDDQIILEPSEDWFFTTFFEAEGREQQHGSQNTEKMTTEGAPSNGSNKSSKYGPLTEYMFDYIRWIKDEEKNKRPFGRVFQQYQSLRDLLYSCEDHTSASFGYTKNNPIMGVSTQQIDHFIQTLKKEDGKDWEIKYINKERTTVHGHENILVYEYSVMLNNEEYCKMYGSPYGRGTIHVPKGFIIPEDEYKRSVEVELKTSKTKTALVLYRCIGCNSDILPNEEYCCYCGMKNAFYNPEYSTDMLEDTDYNTYANTLWYRIKCNTCDQKTRQKLFCNGKEADTLFCTKCGHRLIKNHDNKNAQTVFSISWSMLVDGAFGAKRVGNGFSLYKNGDISIQGVILENKISRTKINQMMSTVDLYKPILFHLQAYCTQESRGKTYYISFDDCNLSSTSVRKCDLYSVPASQVEQAFFGNIVTELFTELSDLFNCENTGISIKLTSGAWNDYHDIDYLLTPAVEEEIKGKKEKEESETLKKPVVKAAGQRNHVERLDEKAQKTGNEKPDGSISESKQSVQKATSSNSTVDKSWSYQPGDLFRQTDTETVAKKKKAISALSVVAFIVSLAAFGAYCLTLTLKIKEAIPVWEVLGVISIFLPAIAKRVRISKDKSGKGLEIAAIVIGGFAFAMIIYLLTKWPMYLCYLGWIIGGLIYKFAGRENK